MVFKLLFPIVASARAQIGVYIDRLDAKCRRPASTTRSKTESQTFTAPHPDRPISGFLRIDVPAGG
jgi:hypothetical protein